MIKYLLPKDGCFYKANLHCHTKASDGRLTAAEVKKLYMKHGYSIVAFTDHDVYVPHPELTDKNFVALHGFEFGAYEKDIPWPTAKACHICMISLDENSLDQPFWYVSDFYGDGNPPRPDVKIGKNTIEMHNNYTPEDINYAIKLGKERNCFVTYNHPTWSMESYPEYSKYEGMDAVEIINYGSLAAGFLEHDNVAYDDLLRQGKRIFCTATDDNHNAYPEDHFAYDSFGGYVMIKAAELNYKNIANALKNGEFYASEGPEIHELWYDDEKHELHVKTSDAQRIVCTTAARHARVADKSRIGQTVNEAVFTLDCYDKYARITVIDEKGKCAYSNAFFDLNT